MRPDALLSATKSGVKSVRFWKICVENQLGLKCYILDVLITLAVSVLRPSSAHHVIDLDVPASFSDEPPTSLH